MKVNVVNTSRRRRVCNIVIIANTDIFVVVIFLIVKWQQQRSDS
jgi:hypothetical protein